MTILDVFNMEGVSFRHHDNLPFILKDVDLSIPENGRTAVLGANGAGKTTLFYSLTGVYKPSKGEVLYRGKPVEYTKEGLTELRSEVAVVLQNPDEQMFSSTVEEDVAFGPMNIGVPRDEVGERIDRALRDVRMSDYRWSPLQQLSGGQRKRVAIAGALAVRPKVMIMDEPTAGLDPQSSMEVMELAERLHLEGVTVIISTHDVDLAYVWADGVRVLRHGHMIYGGDSEGFYEDIDNVLLSGLLRPSTFSMNREISSISGVDESPYPKTVSEYLAKFGGGNGVTGRIFCIPYSGGPVGDRYAEAVREAGDGARIGLYGTESRYAATDESEKIDFYFDGIDSCLSEAVLGRDSVLIYDSVYEPMVREKAGRLSVFGADIDMQVIG
ncbi:energy-coupling factor ABC transporter ATP-binding protein [Methanomethylophilus alvi]|uniref:energy-coupling factor ABC transporter ATP-binding protein n=1 Tax=Methanomethylophilus alvi TaxID=1291540 RepID=UPI0037DBFA47